MQERFCNSTNVVVPIVKCRKQLLVSREGSSVAPLQVTNKQVQSVAMWDGLRHVGQSIWKISLRTTWPSFSLLASADYVRDDDADSISQRQQKHRDDQ